MTDVVPAIDRRPVLLYDGYCGLCNRAVQWVLRHDPAGEFRFAPLDDRFAVAVRDRHPELLGVDSLVLVRPCADGGEEVLVRSRAVLAVAGRLKGWRWLAAVGQGVPLRLRDWVYDRVARSRTRWFGRLDRCPIPTAEQRARFLLDGEIERLP